MFVSENYWATENLVAINLCAQNLGEQAAQIFRLTNFPGVRYSQPIEHNYHVSRR